MDVTATTRLASGHHVASQATAAPAEPFAQIFKNAIKPTQAASIAPAAATLSSPLNTRSTFFMQNMPIEQRRSAVEEESFRPQSAALEQVKGAGGRVLTQNAVDGG